MKHIENLILYNIIMFEIHFSSIFHNYNSQFSIQFTQQIFKI